MSKLTGEQLEELTKLLADTLNEFNLEVIVHVSTGDRLHVSYTSDQLPLKRQIRQTLEVMEGDGITGRFLSEVWRRRPHRQDVRDMIGALFPEAPSIDPQAGPSLSLQHGGAGDGGATDFAVAPGLRKNVKPHLHNLDLGTWPQELLIRRGRVCKVELDDGSSGTGFLVGPSAVLTNWHVVRDHLGPGKAAGITCRFDFITGAVGQPQQNKVVKLGAKGVLDWSPCSDAELQTTDPDAPPPTADELDYALLELAEPLGDTRGFELLPAAPPAAAQLKALLIFQHPQGSRMKLALDTDSLIGVVHGGLRLRYRTNTDEGSSGSPCFTMDWDLVALHHYGDPQQVQDPQFNQGVPIELVRQRIIANGRAAALGLG